MSYFSSIQFCSIAYNTNVDATEQFFSDTLYILYAYSEAYNMYKVSEKNPPPKKKTTKLRRDVFSFLLHLFVQFVSYCIE